MNQTCESCRFISHCHVKCFNPYYILMSENHCLPVQANKFFCVFYQGLDGKKVFKDNLTQLPRKGCTS